MAEQKNNLSCATAQNHFFNIEFISWHWMRGLAFLESFFVNHCMHWIPSFFGHEQQWPMSVMMSGRRNSQVKGMRGKYSAERD